MEWLMRTARAALGGWISVVPQIYNAPYSPSDPMSGLYPCNGQEGLLSNAMEPVAAVSLDIPDPSPSSPPVGTSLAANEIPLNSEAAEESPSGEVNAHAPSSPSSIQQQNDETASSSPILLVPTRGVMASGNVSSPGQRPQDSPQLRFQSLIEVSRRRGIGSLGPSNQHDDESYDGNARSATSPERLTCNILHSQGPSMASRKRKFDFDKEDKSCECAVNFQCCICLEIAQEPVVTPCGHLFCWSCLYQWLHAHSKHSECPVCKGEVLEVNVTPIYGRGGGSETTSHVESGGASPASKIPPRPHARRVERSRPQRFLRPVSTSIAEFMRIRYIRAEETQTGVQIQGSTEQGRNGPGLEGFQALEEEVAFRANDSSNPSLQDGVDGTLQALHTQPSSSADGASTLTTLAITEDGDVAPMDDVNDINRAGSSPSARTTDEEIGARRRRLN